ncbi:VCBS repeat-containing protein [Gluconobacter sp. R71646]|uniref:VCBS repeat-containing protein n=1 Tax=Gluconobacter potus TaxID=2724927 RepID=A0ABR9YPH4_9PROT|nr:MULTISPECIES: VCBS repeat-containing protein [Gluconobacter]MBF0865371.1 VCBS repeat-containing protein [Gluconobacter sp. R71656]MBF0868863.1 VCBS repeat-containing protein [Gluconobacter sp. R75628]MBF0874860.1 VCBS repeat-containing protein [Gluconobacter sp. R75629]MBF0883524.1 VCBS repeat-containing protein [Gluconobacter potus]GFE97878.1 hypothetical protein DmGdi_29510 [Gluconobacter sp. Gdi]
MKENISATIVAPKFEQEVVDEFLRDGYWVDWGGISAKGRNEIIGYGPTMGEIFLYSRDTWFGAPFVGGWRRKLLTNSLTMPVAMDLAPLDGTGRLNPIICYDLYGCTGTFRDPSGDGGKLAWLEPGPSPDVPWQHHLIGQIPALHRFRVGNFTTSGHMEIIGFPIVGLNGTHAVLPIVLFSSPSDGNSREKWPSKIINNGDFRFVHGVELIRGGNPTGSADALLICSDEGVRIFFYDINEEKWAWQTVGSGEGSQLERTGFKGSGDAAIGHLGSTGHDIVLSLEPFHGNTVCIYYATQGCSNLGSQWSRDILDVYGDPNELGEGPGHCVVAADFDNDGDDEFLVGLRGPEPWQGVYYYKIIDPVKGMYLKWKVSDASVARIKLIPREGAGVVDFATIGYSVKNYFEANNSQIVMHYFQKEGL